MKFALVGNQNCGKTTFFNQLTGANQHVGNFPGVTVDQKVGLIRSDKTCSVVDLPGIYSLRPFSDEEIVTRNFIFDQKPDGIINIVDATNIERNLYLTLQLIEMHQPMVLVLNMMDEVRNNCGTIDIDKMSELLGIPVIPVSAFKNEGLEEVISKVIEVAKDRILPTKRDFCIQGPVHRCVHAIAHIIEGHAEKIGIYPRFCAIKCIEGDAIFAKRLDLKENEKQLIEHSVKEMEDESGLDRNAALADMRYQYIENVISTCVVKCKESKEHKRSMKIDKILTNKYAAVPLFFGIMLLIFYLTFGLIGKALASLMQLGIDWLSGIVINALSNYGLNVAVIDFIQNGIFEGIGAVLSFLPYIIILFFFLSMLEDSGYMGRVAFIMDKPLRKIGLSGKSFVPMLIGFGCSVPAILSTRTLSSERDKKLTILLIPFISCSAKILIYTTIATSEIFTFPVLIIFGLYILGIGLGLLLSFVMSKTVYKGNSIPFIMELPNYRLPSLKSVVLLMWEKAKDFITKAFTVIFIATVVIWLLKAYDLRLNYVGDNTENSILALLGSFVLPIFQPIGIKNGNVVAALIAGFTAKEAVISTLYMLTDNLSTLFINKAGALGFLVFTLLYTPCVAVIATVKKELCRRKAWKMVFWQCVIAWVVAFIVYNTASLILGYSVNAINYVVVALLFIWLILAIIYIIKSKAKNKDVHISGCNCQGYGNCRRCMEQKRKGK
jgi:ferrous iron transport protein B